MFHFVHPHTPLRCVNSQCAYHFFKVTREKELSPNGRFSGCNLMRHSSNPKQDQFIRNIYYTAPLLTQTPATCPPQKNPMESGD